MIRTLSVAACIMLVGCNTGNQTTGSINAPGAHVNGNITNTVTNTGNPTTSIPVNIALDPAAFSSIFGLGVKSVTKPNPEQLKAMADVASKQGSSTLAEQVRKCSQATDKCTVKPN
jgi:hypothetical protein